MINVIMQCDKCHSQAIEMTNFERFNDSLAFSLPQNWMLIPGTGLFCERCIQKIIKKEINNVKD